MSQLNAGDAVFTNINIGQDASTLSGSAAGAKGTAGLFGQQADSAYAHRGPASRLLDQRGQLRAARHVDGNLARQQPLLLT